MLFWKPLSKLASASTRCPAKWMFPLQGLWPKRGIYCFNLERDGTAISPVWWTEGLNQANQATQYGKEKTKLFLPSHDARMFCCHVCLYDLCRMEWSSCVKLWKTTFVGIGRWKKNSNFSEILKKVLLLKSKNIAIHKVDKLIMHKKMLNKINLLF